MSNEGVALGRMEAALRRAGGIPKLARTPEGRGFLLRAVAAEAEALREAAFRDGWHASQTGYGPDDLDGALRAYRIGWRPCTGDDE